MKKILAIALILVMVFTLAACNNGTTDSGTGGGNTGAGGTGGGSTDTGTGGGSTGGGSTDTGSGGGGGAAQPEGIELILITDLGTIDDRSFNQGAWEGLVKYATENGISHDYIQPAEQSDEAYLNAIDLAVQMGAKVIVTPGFLFEVPIFTAQSTYPNVKFILIDGTPHSGDYNPVINSNTVGITYAEHESGFLAGYAAVMGGMAVPALVRFGHGYVQGAEVAAQELGLADGAVTMNYYYTGVFWPLPEILTMSTAWYNDGIEVIFAAGGAIFDSIFPAAEQAGKFAIGVDVDQSNLSPAVITSAMKQLAKSVYDKIDEFYKGTFPGGQHVIYDAANGGVGLPMNNSHSLGSFNQAAYDAIYAKLANGTIRVSDDIGISPDQIPATKVVVTFFN